jgi:hypothetical protein
MDAGGCQRRPVRKTDTLLTPVRHLVTLVFKDYQPQADYHSEHMRNLSFMDIAEQMTHHATAQLIVGETCAGQAWIACTAGEHSLHFGNPFIQIISVLGRESSRERVI